MHHHALVQVAPARSAATPGPDGALLLRVPEVCQRLNLSRATVQRLLSSGALPSVKVGSARRVTLPDLEQFVHELGNARTVETTPGGAR